MKKSLKVAIPLSLGIVFVLVFGYGIAVNSTRVSSVSVRLQEGKDEHMDKTVFGIGKKNVNPDYNLQIRAAKGHRWLDCGTYADTRVGDGLRFDVAEMVPLRSAVELRLLDKDKVESDVLDQVPIQRRTSIDGNTYSFELNTVEDVHAGFEWFFDTPIGKIIATGFVIAIVILVIAALV